MNKLIPISRIENGIFLIRGQKVMLDRDLAELYGVTTRNLKRQVRRNIDRFPSDFMFTLNEKDVYEMVCQFGTPFRSKFGGALPFAFTEHGILMLSSVLNSKKAIQVNIRIMRVFNKLRQAAIAQRKIAEKIEELEKKYGKHDVEIGVIFKTIKRMIEPPNPKPSRKIGFVGDNSNCVNE